MNARWIAVLALAGLIAGGCGGKKQARSESKLSRIFSQSSDGPQYAWDGTASTGIFNVPPAQAFAQAEAGLKKLGFELSKAEPPRAGNGGELRGSRENLKVTVTVKNAATSSAGAEHAEVRVQVGALGERSGGERILDEMARTAPLRSR